eukprot:858087-Prymnesium_polylepis.1
MRTRRGWAVSLWAACSKESSKRSTCAQEGEHNRVGRASEPGRAKGGAKGGASGDGCVWGGRR